MRVNTNDKLIERQARIARYATFGGLAILVAAVVTNVSGSYPLWVPFALMFVGFVIAYFGAILANKWIKEPRADHALAKALKGFDNKYHLYNYLLPASHVLLSPSGLLIFRVKSNDGKITCQNDRWNSPFRWSRLFGGMGQDPLGNPSTDLREDLAKMKKLLADKVEGAAIVPIDGYVVFSDPRAELYIDNCSVAIVRVEDLKDTLRKSKRGPVLQPKLIEDLDRALSEQADAKAAK